MVFTFFYKAAEWHRDHETAFNKFEFYGGDVIIVMLSDFIPNAVLLFSTLRTSNYTDLNQFVMTLKTIFQLIQCVHLLFVWF